jgi:hypothetical protein
LFANGLAAKVAGQDGFDLGQGVEPVEDGAAVQVIGEAAVEFMAQGARKTGDYSFAEHNFGILAVAVFRLSLCTQLRSHINAAYTFVNWSIYLVYIWGGRGPFLRIRADENLLSPASRLTKRPQIHNQRGSRIQRPRRGIVVD